ncbi:MAG: cyclic nucleotide-binding domain-containing protein [Deltaproteobacteria bacterium]|nr:cyclic nucleotide-binding domain-containing protein [Deltaproteobacteria bacterium]
MPVTPEQLKRFGIFSQIPRDILLPITNVVRTVSFPAQSVIFNEGSTGDRMYLLEKGQVRISKFISGVGEEALSILNEGSYFGEMSLIDAFPRSATAIAHTDCELFEIYRDDFVDMLQSDRDLAYFVMWSLLKTLSHRLRETNEKIKAFFAMTGGF